MALSTWLQTGYNLPNFGRLMMDDKLPLAAAFDKVQYFDQVKLSNFIASSKLEGVEVVASHESVNEILARYQRKETMPA